MGLINESFDYENLNNLTDLLKSDNELASLSTLVPDWSKIVVVIFIVIAMIIGIPGNSLVTTILLKIRHRSSTDWFVIFITITDIMSLLISGPTHISTILPEIWTAISSTELCRFHIYFSHFVVMQSTFLITLVGIDRYLKTCKPYITQFTARSAIICCVVLTIASAIINISHLFTTQLNVDSDCVLDSSRTTLRLIWYGFFLLFNITTAIVLGFLYSRIAVKIRQRVKVKPLPINLPVDKSSGISQRKSMQLRSIAKETGTLNVTIIRVQPKKTTLRVLAHLPQQAKTYEDKTKKDKKLDGEPSDSLSRNNRENAVRGIRIQKRHYQITQSCKQVNKTTKIMGAITVVYIISTLFPAIAMAILTSLSSVKNHPIGRIVIFFMVRLYMMNNFANPIFYMWLSSTFRKNARDTFKRCMR